VNWLQVRQQNLLTAESSEKSSANTDVPVETVAHTEAEPSDSSCDHTAVSKVCFLSLELSISLCDMVDSVKWLHPYAHLTPSCPVVSQ